MAYCDITDLLTGDIVIGGTALDPTKFVADAADEIDSQIGMVYITPVPADAPRPVLLLLKRLNAHLATGRLIMAADAAGQRSELHAYGESLVKEVTASLAAIAAGTVELPIMVDPVLHPVKKEGGPLIHNVDSLSQVEQFYGAVTGLTIAGLPSPYPYAGG